MYLFREQILLFSPPTRGCKPRIESFLTTINSRLADTTLLQALCARYYWQNPDPRQKRLRFDWKWPLLLRTLASRELRTLSWYKSDNFPVVLTLDKADTLYFYYSLQEFLDVQNTFWRRVWCFWATNHAWKSLTKMKHERNALIKNI